MNTPQKHPYDALIRQWLDNYGTHTVIAKTSNGAWSEIVSNSWSENWEYKLIPNQHLDVALALYNDGAEVEFLNLDRREWLTASSPSWRAKQYRIKPKTKTVWVGIDPSGYVVTSQVYVEGFKEVVL